MSPPGDPWSTGGFHLGCSAICAGVAWLLYRAINWGKSACTRPRGRVILGCAVVGYFLCGWVGLVVLDADQTNRTAFTKICVALALSGLVLGLVVGSAIKLGMSLADHDPEPESSLPPLDSGRFQPALPINDPADERIITDTRSSVSSMNPITK
jgi:hypothetical protein